MNRFLEEIKGKKVLVFGLGRQGGGQGDADWLNRHGAEVRISDRDTTLAPGGENKADIDWADVIIKNPAVPDDHALITYAKSLGKPVETSIALFVKYSPIPVIGVTGTRGKSTTVALIGVLLEHVFPKAVVMGGNIPGTSGLSLFDQVDNKQYAVLELSSFQLHSLHDLRVSPHIAVITNLYPDHLNRYKTMDEYRRGKEAIVAYQKPDDLTLVNQENDGALLIAKASSGKISMYSAKDVADWEIPLPGLHNRENVAAMWAVAKALAITEDVARHIVQEFPGLPHRLETIRETKGVKYLNDTTSTTPTAAIYALRAMVSPTIWITGGDTKKLPFEELLQEVEQNTHLEKIIILGSQNIPDYTSALKKIAGSKISGEVRSMADAVTLAASLAKPGDAVLLSPGFASFDLFKNEFDRGVQFNDAVASL